MKNVLTIPSIVAGSKNGGGVGGTTNYEDLTNKPQVNGIVLSGNKTSADLGITTLTPFPSTWPTTGRFEDLLAAIRVDTIAVKGASFLGEVTFDDLPANLGNAEIKVEILEGTTPATKVIHSVITSGNRQPYRWEYTSWNSGNSNSGWISFQLPLTAGDGISIENNVISTTGGADAPEDVYTQSNLLAGKGIEIVPEPVEGGIDEHTLACWHFDDSTSYITGSGEVKESTIVRGDASIDSSFHKFGTGSVKSSGEGAKIRTIQLSLAQSFTYDFWLLKRGPSNYSEGIGFYNDYARNIFSYLVYSDTPDTAAFYVEGKDVVNVDISEINSDSWYHVALVYDASSDKGVGKLFINGILKATIIDITKNTNTFPYTLISPGIGCYMDELRISDIARPLTTDGKFPVPTQPYSVAVPTGNKVINNTGVTSINTKKGNVTLTADDINVTYTHEGAETTTSIKEFADTIDHAIENVNSLIPVNAYTAENLIAGKNITIEEVLPEGGIDGHTLACWHFDGDVINLGTDQDFTINTERASYDTLHKQFGESSIAPSAYIKVPSTKVYANPLTFDFWCRITDSFWGPFESSYLPEKVGFKRSGNSLVVNRNGSVIINCTTNISDSNFHHYAVVYTLNDISVYIDGILQGKYDRIVQDISITNDRFLGPNDIDELRISDIVRPLTPDGKFPVPTQAYSVAVPTGNKVINNTITKTSQLTNDSGFITDVPVATTTVAGKMKADGTTITVTEDGTISAVTPSIDVPSDVYTQSNLLAGKNITIEEVLPEGGIDGHTLACFHCDGNVDDATNNKYITPNNSFTNSEFYNVISPKFGSASLTPGGGGYDRIFTNNTILLSTFTLDLWMKKSRSSIYVTMSLPDNYVFNQDTWKFYKANQPDTILISSISTPDNSNWHHFAFTYEPNKICIFIDGILQGDCKRTSDNFYLGAVNFNGTYDLDEIRFSDIVRPLTPDGKFPVPTQAYSVAESTGKVAINNAITKTSQLTNDSGFLTSIPENLVTSDNVTKIVKLTQAEYDSLTTKDENTLYYIVG